MFGMFLKLLMAHALSDFSLQSDVMAKGKNRHNITVAPKGQKYVPCWHYWMSAHALIHGGAVWLVTGSMTLGIIEVIAHWIIDFIKCEGITNPHQDQVMHIGLRIIYAIAA